MNEQKPKFNIEIQEVDCVEKVNQLLQEGWKPIQTFVVSKTIYVMQKWAKTEDAESP